MATEAQTILPELNSTFGASEMDRDWRHGEEEGTWRPCRVCLLLASKNACLELTAVYSLMRKTSQGVGETVCRPAPCFELNMCANLGALLNASSDAVGLSQAFLMSWQMMPWGQVMRPHLPGLLEFYPLGLGPFFCIDQWLCSSEVSSASTWLQWNSRG